MITYNKSEVVSFRKTKEAWGGLSNMAAGYPIVVEGTKFRTSEALYQACRFPDLPSLQKAISEHTSPMGAKMATKPWLSRTRPDWNEVRTSVMMWAIRCKLVQNKSFGDLLKSTGTKEIVEDSHKDSFWGAIPTGDTLVGENILGRLLMGLRKEVDTIESVEPLKIDNFNLFGFLIGIVNEKITLLR